ncbi:hypothetical protein BAUCODRAFT_63612 [Baudoinia panamericana UAMH 10762]|uniref:Cytochrome P450 n=1 Tax=Baudoinia panamericana (strain UAMH 10762) TaxID=717646 RepID=M2NKX8_BAUPA|nr:uncharacterized protein BAUCODRAFT_63612 [Baudoinia panamericana UAMH 10762]EMD00115.1 hypothetical protein BAUCODRAFT_63612 [Baudoinia panamericana UAMH 10762]
MDYRLLLPLFGLVISALYYVANNLNQKRKFAAKEKELQCRDAPMYPGGGFLGINHVKEMMAADQNQAFPDLLIRRQEKMNAVTGRICDTFRTDALGQTMYFTSDPKNIQAMLATQFEDYDLGPARRGNMIRTLGDGIFVQDFKQWEHSRQMLRPNFIREQVSDLDLEERHVENLLKVLPVGPDGWTAETNIQPLFFRLTIDSASEFLFGESVDSQIAESGANSEKDELAFSKNFDSAQLHMAKSFRFGDLYWLHNPKEFKQNNKVVNEFVAHYVNLALQHSTQEKKAEERARDRYVFLEALTEQTRDPEEIRAQLLNILLAGRDTTASLLSWLFKLLLRNPQVFQKLRSTVIDTFGTYEDPQDITFATLKGCQYLQHTINEALRLWPVVPGNARRSNKVTTLPRGGGPDGKSPILIPPQTDVNYSVHVTHRRKDIWGPDADEFKPERFAGRKPGWEFLPFNGGPRICIGQQFALTEASYVTVRLLQRFDAIQPGQHELEDEPMRSALTLTNSPARGVMLRLHEAKS